MKINSLGKNLKSYLLKISRNLKVNKNKPPDDLPKMAQQWVTSPSK
jgi:hypothetical protein